MFIDELPSNLAIMMAGTNSRLDLKSRVIRGSSHHPVITAILCTTYQCTEVHEFKRNIEDLCRAIVVILYAEACLCEATLKDKCYRKTLIHVESIYRITKGGAIAMECGRFVISGQKSWGLTAASFDVLLYLAENTRKIRDGAS